MIFSSPDFIYVFSKSFHHLLNRKVVDVPIAIVEEKIVRIELIYRTVQSPHDLGFSSDKREIKLAFKGMSISEK
jgi:hypothetical protein